MDVLSIFEQGMIMAIVSVGVFVSFRVIDMPDLTPDGSYVTGAAVSVILMYSGIPWFLCVFLGAFFAGVSGFFTALIVNKLKVNSLLASILIMTMLYSVNIRIMDAPNLPVPDGGNYSSEKIIQESNKLDDLLGDFDFQDGIDVQEKQEIKKVTLSPLKRNNRFLVLFLILCGSLIILYILFKTEFGIALRGFGGNKEGIKNLGMNPNILSSFGMFFSNFLAGLGGAIFASYAGFSDVNMGTGIVVTSLASIIIGEILIGKLNFAFNIFAPVIGAIIYQFLLAVAMKYGYAIGFKSSDMKLLTALFIILVIGFEKLEVKKWFLSKK
ncbi:MAG: putative tryptophan/tyrosine transport system permease protein [Oceanotoga sp.]|uniref:ABC transporter permease n=1 Tax=Oceanotoga sp. TaxID=2108366 RepID=UPI0026523718|nr:ABC transporter permease [Oceanotoga sp.]MDN5343282.1 putative tryptophan/tyrosine transport system permease protein [Oceanotoga sp.]